MHEKLDALHAEVDARASEVAQKNGARLRCGRGCASCCVDGLTVLSVEAELIRTRHAAILESEAPAPLGRCAFLDAADACRIYPDRPYVCRTQGLPLRWFEEDSDDQIVEQRDICPINLEGPKLSSLSDDACWLIGPYEERLLDLGDDLGLTPERVALRALFRDRSTA